ncbi:MAG: flagellar motor protein MotB, partial [Planctomycetota bacterium]
MARPLKLRVGSGPARDETEVRWLISYSDFMMQLVCLFLLLYAATALAPEVRRRA